MDIFSLQTGPFGINTWIVPLCGNKALVFDPGACSFTQDSSAITDFLKKEGMEPAAFILTHGHFDHITGTGVMKKAFPEVPLICHKADAGMIGSNAVTSQGNALEMMGLEMLARALENLPDADVTFSGEVLLSELVKTEDADLTKALGCWKALCTPGHTPGSVCWYNAEQKILISGDTIFYHSWGRTDLPGGSEAQIMKSLNRVYSELPEDVKVCPGHEYAGFTLGENR